MIESKMIESKMTGAGQPLIQIQDLTKVFYTDEIETHALSGIHLSIDKGEYVAMSGPSGCGKSTLLSIIGLLDTPTAGRYSLNGKTVENLDFAERSRIRNQEIGFIFQSFNLIGDLTVYENVELPLTYRQKMPAADRKARVMEALELSLIHISRSAARPWDRREWRAEPGSSTLPMPWRLVAETLLRTPAHRARSGHRGISTIRASL